MNIIISNTSKEPIYKQLEIQIIDQVVSGTLVENTPLPSIRKLARILGISVITVKRAYEDLEREGYINTISGKGSFVSNKDIDMLIKKQTSKLEKNLAKIIHDMFKLGIDKNEIIKTVSVLCKEDLKWTQLRYKA